MTSIRPVRCLLAKRLATPANQVTPACRALFHSSPQLQKRRKPRFSNVKASAMGLKTEEDVQRFTQETFSGYSKEQMEVLQERYTPEQLAAIEAGEAAIDPKDLTIQGRLRRDPYRFNYFDDFSKIYPSIDKQPKKGDRPDPNARFMNTHEWMADFEKWLMSFAPKDVNYEGMTPEQIQEDLEKRELITRLDVQKYFHERSSMTDGNLQTKNAFAPELGKEIPGVAGLYNQNADSNDAALDPNGDWKTTTEQTGLTVFNIKKELTVKIIVSRIVSNQTRLGKIRSYSYLAIAGNGNGVLGIGEGKATESKPASQRAQQLAIKNMRPIPRYEERTIYGNMTAKVGGTVVQLYSRPPGFGLRVNHRIFEMCRAAGIHDLSARMPRAKTPLNMVKAAYQALVNQRDPNEIAIGRGKKLIDVRKVYYGGAVY